MSDKSYHIWCLLEGETALFTVIALPAIPISNELEDLVKEKNGVLSSIDANDLTLWKVRMTSVVIHSDITGDTTLAYKGYPSQAI